MKHSHPPAKHDLLSPPGLDALRRLANQPALLAFDLDGTLAPIVAQPAHARVADATAQRLQALVLRWPVAVITGRALDDAAPRLGFTPHHLVGNHGAEWRHGPGKAGDAGRSSAAAQQAEKAIEHTLDACRERLHPAAGALRERGIGVEDKRLSLALHYRSSRDRRAARAWLDALCATLGPAVLASHGHCVLNLTATRAGDKGDALLALLRDTGTSRCLVVGDDSNDEAAFRKAPPGSVTARIGPAGTPSEARFRLSSQTRVDALLDVLLGLRR